MSFFAKIRGTYETLFRLGKGGPQLKNNVGVIELRNAADGAFVIGRGLAPTPGGVNDFVTLGSQPGGFTLTLGDVSSATAITAGVKSYITYFPYAMTITGWYISGSPSGSIVMDIWKKALGAGIPTVADTITGTEKPTLTAQTQNSDTTLATWITSVAVGDFLVFVADSASTVTFSNLVVIGTRT